MNDTVRQKLKEIIAQYGTILTKDARRIEALLRDLSGEHEPEIFVLVSTVKEGAAYDLLVSQNSTPRELLMKRLAHRLQKNLALEEGAAKWAVESWAIALDDKNASSHALSSSENDALSHNISDEHIVTPTIVVSQQGSGLYTTISGALVDAGVGTRIFVRQGLYRENIVIDKPVEIIGDGLREQIVIEAKSNCILMQTDYAKVSGLTFRCRVEQRKKDFFAVNISQGRLLLEDCDISSNTLACVAIHGSAADPVIQRCKIHDGSGNGVLVWDNGQGIVKECDIFGNAIAGVKITKGGITSIRHCKIHHQKRNGIEVSGQSQPTLEKNACFQNKRSGILFYDRATGNAQENTCEDNGMYGIFVSKHAKPILEGNTCSGNLKSGIYVGRQASPTLNGNHCQENDDSGIVYYGNATGIARNNTSTGNRKNGICVCEQAQPILENNTCQENKWNGVAYLGAAAGRAQNNLFLNNEWNGVFVGGRAYPILEDNTCKENKMDGISVRNHATPHISANICQDNGKDGIYVASTAQPMIEVNQYQNNKGKGLNDHRN